MAKTLIVCALSALCGSLAFTQNYQCNWSVVDMGGGLMSSTSYRTLPSVGQTAIGLITSTNYQGFIGFWQMDTALVGVREQSRWSQAEPLVTMLYSPFPNPCPRTPGIQVRYSLATETRVTLRMYDLTGKLVNRLLDGTQKPGRYSLQLSVASLPQGGRLAQGVYFLKMKAGDYQGTQKLIVQ
jgi:hypothetical protein